MINQKLLEESGGCLSQDQRKLLSDGQECFSLVENHKTTLSDYSFLVASFAKAYEGFLKDFFLKISLIDERQYQSDHFRVGKALNPSLRYKRFSIYQRLADLDPEGELLAEALWQAWKQSRNQILHWFPHNLKKLDLNEAKERAELILQTIIKTCSFLQKHPQARKYQSI